MKTGPNDARRVVWAIDKFFFSFVFNNTILHRLQQRNDTQEHEKGPNGSVHCHSDAPQPPGFKMRRVLNPGGQGASERQCTLPFGPFLCS